VQAFFFASQGVCDVDPSTVLQEQPRRRQVSLAAIGRSTDAIRVESAQNSKPVVFREYRTMHIGSLLTMSRTRLFCSLTALLLSFVFVSSAFAQVFPRGNGISLTGIRDFDVYVDVNQWTDMTGERTEFRINTQAVFEEALQEAGLRLRPAVREYLICKVQATRSGRDVAYVATLQFWEIDSIDLNRLLWERGNVAVVSQRDFSEERIAQECAGYFLEEWRLHNPT
jgi:hypothetical protein